MVVDSQIDRLALARARILLLAPKRADAVRGALAAAAFVAISAMALAATVIIMPLSAPVERPETGTLAEEG